MCVHRNCDELPQSVLLLSRVMRTTDGLHHGDRHQGEAGDPVMPQQGVLKTNSQARYYYVTGVGDRGSFPPCPPRWGRWGPRWRRARTSWSPPLVVGCQRCSSCPMVRCLRCRHPSSRTSVQGNFMQPGGGPPDHALRALVAHPRSLARDDLFCIARRGVGGRDGDGSKMMLVYFRAFVT